MNCVKCKKRAFQYYNGLAYCADHHPMATCPHCGEQMGKFPKPGEWCKRCQDRAKQAQMPLPFDPYGNTGVTNDVSQQITNMEDAG